MPGSPSTGSGSVSAAKQGAAHAPGTIVEGEQRIEVPGKLVEGSAEQPVQTTETPEGMPKAIMSRNQNNVKMGQGPQSNVQPSKGRSKLPDTTERSQPQRSITFREVEDNHIPFVESSVSTESENHEEQPAKQAKPDDTTTAPETKPAVTVNSDTRISPAGAILPTNSPDPTITNLPLPNERKNESSTTLNASKDGNLSREITRSEETRRSGPAINEETRQSRTSENVSKRTQERHSWDQNSRAGRSSFMPPIWGNSEKRIGKKVIFCDLRNGVVKIQPTNSINREFSLLL